MKKEVNTSSKKSNKIVIAVAVLLVMMLVGIFTGSWMVVMIITVPLGLIMYSYMMNSRHPNLRSLKLLLPRRITIYSRVIRFIQHRPDERRILEHLEGLLQVIALRSAVFCDHQDRIRVGHERKRVVEGEQRRQVE